MFAIPDHRPVPGAVLVAAVVGSQEADDVARAAEGQFATRRPVGQFHVGQHQRGQDGLTWELRAEEIAHGAVRAVGADDVGGTPRPGVLRIVVVLRSRGDRHAVGILLECNDFEAAPNVGALHLGVLRERPVDIRLRGDRDELVCRSQMRQIDSRAREDRNAGRLVRVRENVVGKAAGVEDLEGSGHRRERAARRVDLGPPFEHHHRAAAPGQVARGGQPGGSGTDDDDIHRVRGIHDQTAGVASAGLGYHRRMSSGVDVAE